MVELTVLYRSENLLVRQVSTGAPMIQVVTFDHYDIGIGHDRPGFGEYFFCDEGVDAIHILGRGNHWYQYDDMARAIAAARSAIPDGARVVTYGSSMGGYAALRWADTLKADWAVALSPQYSIDPTVVPWEHRWSQDARQIQWGPNARNRIAPHARSIVVYDSSGNDRRHANMIGRDTGGVLIRAPNVGHPATTFLGESGLLKSLLRAVLDDVFDPKAFQRELLGTRKTSSVYLSQLANVQPTHRPRTAVAIARRAVDIAPNGLLALHSLVKTLTRAGDYDGALDANAKLMPLIDRAELYYPAYVEALLGAKRFDEAIGAARTIVPPTCNKAHLRNWMADVLWQSGRHEEAVAEQCAAREIERGNAVYLGRLAEYRLKRQALRIYALLAKPLRRFRKMVSKVRQA